MKNTWVIYIIGRGDDEYRTEYLCDVFRGFETREEAIKAKREIIGEDGIWTGCDVYAKIRKE